MENNLICIVCPVGCRLKVTKTLDELKIDGNLCDRGITYAHEEITNPLRMVCTTAKIKGGIHSVIPVRTDKPIPDKYKLDVVKEINKIVLTAPVKMGDVVIYDLFGTGVNMIVGRDM